MSRVDDLGGRSNSTTRVKPSASSPTQYPTYLGTTYFPTYSWPTYAPIAVRGKEKHKNIHHKDKEHRGTTVHPSTSPTVIIAPTNETTIKNTTLKSNLTETPTIHNRKHGLTLPSPPTSRPSLYRVTDTKVVRTPPPTPKVSLQIIDNPTHSPTTMPTRNITDVPTPTPPSPASSSKRWSGPSRGRPFRQALTPEPTATVVPNSSQEPTGAPTTAPLATQEPSNSSIRVLDDDDISIKSSESNREGTDQTTKVNLTFRVKENPNYSSNGEKRYKIYGHGQDDDEYASTPTKLPTRDTYEPTLFPTYSPTKKHAGDGHIPTILPSYMPTPGNNENANNVRSTDLSELMYQKRTCPDVSYGFDPTSQMQEQEIIFAYGIQTTDAQLGQNIEKSVEMIQLWILNDVALTFLHCTDDGSSSGRFMRDREYDGTENTVTSVYYTENDFATSFSECTPTYGDATDCAIMQSAIYITAEVDHVDEARRTTLEVIQNRFTSGTYLQGTIVHAIYLGPDLNEIPAISDGSTEKVGVVSHPTTFYIAIGVVFLAGCALVACLAMIIRLRKERRKAAASTIAPGHRHSKLATEDLFLDSYPPSARNSYVFH